MKRPVLVIALLLAAVLPGRAAAASPTPASVTRVSQTLLTTLQDNGSRDPSVEVLYADRWSPAIAFNYPFWDPIPGTGFVNSTGSDAGPGFVLQHYRIAFQVPLEATALSLSGGVSADNSARVLLNSTELARQPDQEIHENFEGPSTPFGTTVQAAFLIGQVNYLYVDVHNFTGPTGLSFTATAAYHRPSLPAEDPCFGSVPTIVGTDGDDTLIGTPGPDVIHGGPGNDTINGLGGDDLLCGGAGDDAIDAGAGSDWIGGNLGADHLQGGDGADVIYGGADPDVLAGGPGNDALFGGVGDDVLSGQAGDDVLQGGIGVDRCAGGEGRDVRAGCESGPA